MTKRPECASPALALTGVVLVTVLINDVNEPPKLLATPDLTMNENTALFSSVGTTRRAADPEAGEAITWLGCLQHRQCLRVDHAAEAGEL